MTWNRCASAAPRTPPPTASGSPTRLTTGCRVRFDNALSAPAVRNAIHQTYPDMMALARPLQGWIDEIAESLWNVVALIVILGMVATALATSGIYGAVSFAVNQRTRELGIRVALGAQRIDIVREVLIAGGKPVLHGLLAGLWLSVAAAAGLRQSVQGSPLRLDTSNPALCCRRPPARHCRAHRNDRPRAPGSEVRPPRRPALRIIGPLPYSFGHWCPKVAQGNDGVKVGICPHRPRLAPAVSTEGALLLQRVIQFIILLAPPAALRALVRHSGSWRPSEESRNREARAGISAGCAAVEGRRQGEPGRPGVG